MINFANKKSMKTKNRKLKFIGLAFLAVGLVVYFSTSSFKSKPETVESTGVVQMTKAMYIDKIYDFESAPNTYKFKGSRPAVVDFYADWCRPCKRIAPIMEELSEQYKGKVDFYKVNVDQENELASVHSVQSIPVVIFFNDKGQPKSSLGALNKEDYISLIEETLKK